MSARTCEERRPARVLAGEAGLDVYLGYFDILHGILVWVCWESGCCWVEEGGSEGFRVEERKGEENGDTPATRRVTVVTACCHVRTRSPHDSHISLGPCGLGHPITCTHWQPVPTCKLLFSSSFFFPPTPQQAAHGDECQTKSVTTKDGHFATTTAATTASPPTAAICHSFTPPIWPCPPSETSVRRRSATAHYRSTNTAPKVSAIDPCLHRQRPWLCQQ